MKRKKLPSWIQHPLVVEFFQTRLGRIISNWVLQGMLYMNPVEIIYKLALDVVLALVLVSVVFQNAGIASIFASVLIAHTANWILNCQPVALLMHIDVGKNNPKKFIRYIEKLERRIQGRPYIAAAASYGSLSKGNYKPKSDIDIRIVMRANKFQRFQAAQFCFFERVRALFSFFPLDLYAFDLDEMKRKMNDDEVPVIFMDEEGILAEAYRETVKFGDFRDRFKRDVLGESGV